jgi:hypothetical protein
MKKPNLKFAKIEERTFFPVLQEGFKLTTPMVVVYSDFHLEIEYGYDCPGNTFENYSCKIITRKEFFSKMKEIRKATGINFSVITVPYSNSRNTPVCETQPASADEHPQG